MANTLSKTGITTGDTVKTWHVTQSVDAFTGIEAYDITISGSLTLGSGTSMAGTASYAVTSLSSSHASFANTSTSASFANTSTSASYAISASHALNGGGGDTFQLLTLLLLIIPVMLYLHPMPRLPTPLPLHLMLYLHHMP